MCSTLLAVRNIRMSFFNSLFTALGKSATGREKARCSERTEWCRRRRAPPSHRDLQPNHLHRIYPSSFSTLDPSSRAHAAIPFLNPRILDPIQPPSRSKSHEIPSRFNLRRQAFPFSRKPSETIGNPRSRDQWESNSHSPIPRYL